MHTPVCTSSLLSAPLYAQSSAKGVQFLCLNNKLFGEFNALSEGFPYFLSLVQFLQQNILDLGKL